MSRLEENLQTTVKDLIPTLQDAFTHKTSYFGVQTLKNPFDMWVYNEIIFEVKPDVIVEIGNKNGGSTLALAHTLDLIGKGRVIGIDLSHNTVPEIVKEHPRITLIESDGVKAFPQVAAQMTTGETVLVIEDSSHTYHNTLAVLREYHGLVTEGSYFIIEDSIIRHGLDAGPTIGPYEAVFDFLEENDDFYIDRDKEKYIVTWNPSGFLRKSTGSKNQQDTSTIQVDSKGPLARLRQFVVYAFTPPIVFLVVNYFRNRY